METRKPVEILQILKSCGYEAYFVGGCVRDTILGRKINDWDITTSALPEQIMACFDHCVPTGIKHGTVTVLQDGVQAEVTTYRADGLYVDGRHPQQVCFVRNLSEDLGRRDFTINAIAMDEQGQVIDLYNGLQDLNDCVIRCVGVPDERFGEDALRMLRAVRFSAQLGFSIENETKAAIMRNGALCGKLSRERIRDEIEKTLCSSRTEKLQDMAAMGLIEICRPEIKRDCRWLSELPEVPIIRWAGLCRTWPDLDLTELRLSKRVAVDATAAGRCDVPKDTLGWKKLISKYGTACARITAALENEATLVEGILASGDCLFLRDLAVSGADFPELKGRQISAHLQKLLMYVLEHPEDNKKEILKSMLKGAG